MRIINIEELREFARRYPRARKPLARWVDIATAASWSSFEDVRDSFGSADYVKGFVVFDIAGNLYRIIATMRYQDQIVIVENVFTHSQYDRWRP